MLIVSLDAGGNLYLEGDRIEDAALRQRLSIRSREDPDLRVALDCDRNLVFQRVTEVMDILNIAGVRNVAIRHEFPR
jgi:biopolymer transport protein ExbD